MRESSDEEGVSMRVWLTFCSGAFHWFVKKRRVAPHHRHHQPQFTLQSWTSGSSDVIELLSIVDYKPCFRHGRYVCPCLGVTYTEAGNRSPPRVQLPRNSARYSVLSYIHNQRGCNIMSLWQRLSQQVARPAP
jgi:hypothetical protein